MYWKFWIFLGELMKLWFLEMRNVVGQWTGWLQWWSTTKGQKKSRLVFGREEEDKWWFFYFFFIFHLFYLSFNNVAIRIFNWGDTYTIPTATSALKDFRSKSECKWKNPIARIKIGKLKLDAQKLEWSNLQDYNWYLPL